MPQITPLYVGVSGYIAEVCRRLEITRMVNRTVSWDETQWKVSPGALTVALVVNILTQRRPLYRVGSPLSALICPSLRRFWIRSAGTTTTFCRVQRANLRRDALFRNLKADPCIVENVYVKSSRRAEALAYLFLLALIVAAYIEIKIRQELKVRRQQFVMPGNRLTDRPAMTSIFDIVQTVLVVLIHTPDGVQQILPSNTDPRVYQILELTGLDQTAYTSKR